MAVWEKGKDKAPLLKKGFRKARVPTRDEGQLLEELRLELDQPSRGSLGQGSGAVLP